MRSNENITKKERFTVYVAAGESPLYRACFTYLQAMSADEEQQAIAGPSAFPRDGRLVSLILASKGIEDADPRVIQQLLDFAYRYTADVLTDAQQLVDHANRPGVQKIEKEDVELAIALRRKYEFFEPPPRDYLAGLAAELNARPLPILPETFDVVRLPPPHQRLTEPNFTIVPDADLVLTDEEGGDEDDEDESEEDEVEEEGANQANGHEDGDGDGDDEDMEEVGVETGSGAPAAPERQLDEDYDE